MPAEKLPIRPGDTKVYTDTLTNTTTGEPISADLEADGWVATCQVRANYAPTSEVIATLTAEITGPNTVKRTLVESESLNLDAVPFRAQDTEKTGKRIVYGDAQLRLPDGLGTGEDYVVTYTSWRYEIEGQVTRDA